MSNHKKGISERTLKIRKAIVEASQEPIELSEIYNTHGAGMNYEAFYQQYYLMKQEGVMKGVGLKARGKTKGIVVQALIKIYTSEYYVMQKDPVTSKREEIKREGIITKVTAGAYHTGQGRKASPRVHIGSTMGMF